MYNLLVMKKRIITYGTFDSFHKGHLNVIQNCIGENNDLFVGIASDEYVKNKGKIPLFNEDERMERIKIIPGVKEVFLEENLEQWEEDYIKYNIDRIVMGSDHIGELDYMFTEKNLNLSYLERTKGVSTTEVKNDLKSSKVGLIYLGKDKSKWIDLIEEAKKECSTIICGVIKEEFSDEELNSILVNLDNSFNFAITYLASIEKRDIDVNRFNVYKIYK